MAHMRLASYASGALAPAGGPQGARKQSQGNPNGSQFYGPRTDHALSLHEQYEDSPSC